MSRQRLRLFLAAVFCLPAWCSQQPRSNLPPQRTEKVEKPKSPKSADTAERSPNTDSSEGQKTPKSAGGGGDWVAPAIGGGVAGAILLGHLLRGEATKISDGGPRLDREFAMNTLVVRGFVAGNWPCAVDFSMPAGIAASLTVLHRNGTRHVAALNPNQAVNGVQIFRIPPEFGNLSVATFSMNAGPSRPAVSGVFRLFGIACGPKAVGSINIDRLTFGPSSIHTAVSTESQYGFRARVTFAQVRAEFMQASTLPNGLKKRRVADEKIGRVSQSEEPTVRQRKVNKSWNGQYSLQVRAWERGDDGGDWILAWSRDLVTVSK